MPLLGELVACAQIRWAATVRPLLFIFSYFLSLLCLPLKDKGKGQVEGAGWTVGTKGLFRE